MVSELVARLRALSQCADIPRYRRRQLMQIVAELEPEQFPSPYDGASDPIFDAYYRRGGLRLRVPPPNERPVMGPGPMMLIARSRTTEGENG